MAFDFQTYKIRHDFSKGHFLGNDSSIPGTYVAALPNELWAGTSFEMIIDCYEHLVGDVKASFQAGTATLKIKFANTDDTPTIVVSGTISEEDVGDGFYNRLTFQVAADAIPASYTGSAARGQNKVLLYFEVTATGKKEAAGQYLYITDHDGDGTGNPDAAVMPYTPADSTHWPGTAPDDVAEALDYLAENLTGLDWQPSVLDKDLTAPPGSPATGARYIVGGSATGDWSGHDDDIAEYDGSNWDYITPDEGFCTTVEDENIAYRYNGSGWVTFASLIDHGLLAGLADDDHTQYEKKATWTAHSILKKDGTGDPAALTVTEESIVARITGGNIAALAIAEATMLGRLTGGNVAALTASQIRTLADVPSNADAVLDSLFDANTILAADTDNTPAALTVAEQTLVGRITGGNIAALTATQIRTLLNVIEKTLTDTYIWVGNGSNEAAAVAVSGDATLANTGALTLNAAHAEQRAAYRVEDLAADADISARPVFVHPRACTLVSVGILTEGAPAGVDDSNTAVIAVKDDAGNTIVSKTYDTANQPPSSDYEDLGSLDGTHKVLSAAEHVTLDVTCGTTADLPAFQIILVFEPTNA